MKVGAGYVGGKCGRKGSRGIEVLILVSGQPVPPAAQYLKEPVRPISL
jgi:hypothetical protein